MPKIYMSPHHVAKGGSSSSRSRGDFFVTGTPQKHDVNAVSSASVSKTMAAGAKQRLQRLHLAPLDKSSSMPSTPVGDQCTLPMKNGLRRVVSTPDMRQDAFTNTGPKSSAARRHREIMEQIENVELDYVKLRFITAEAKKLHQAQDAESRHCLKKTFEDVRCAVKRAGAAYSLTDTFESATDSKRAGAAYSRTDTLENATDSKRAGAADSLTDTFENATDSLKQKEPTPTSKWVAKVVALQTFRGMSACREDFRELCRSLDICMPADEVGAVVPRVQDEQWGTINCCEGKHRALSGQSTACESEAAATWLSEGFEDGDAMTSSSEQHNFA